MTLTEGSLVNGAPDFEVALAPDIRALVCVSSWPWAEEPLGLPGEVEQTDHRSGRRPQVKDPIALTGLLVRVDQHRKAGGIDKADPLQVDHQ